MGEVVNGAKLGKEKNKKYFRKKESTGEKM
jgi:hypothetical protein